MHRVLPKSNRSHDRRRGVSVIELLIVTAILAIIGLLSLPDAGADAVTRLRMAARRLVADLEYAQLQSIGDGADPWVIVFDVDADAYHLARQSDPSTPVTNPATRMPYTVQLGQVASSVYNNVVIDAVTVGALDQLKFDAWGALSDGADAVITLSSGSATVQIQIDADTGEPSVQ